MEVNLSSLSKEDITTSIYYEKRPYDCIRSTFKKVISIGQKLSCQKEQNRVINEAVGYAFKNCGDQEGEMLTEEHIGKLSQLLTEKITPFIAHQLKRPKT